MENRAHLPVPLSHPKLLTLMNEAGVDCAVLVPPSLDGDRNDLCLAAAREHPGRFAVMGRFGDRIGVLEALTFATCVQLVLSLVILLVVRLGTGSLGGAFSVPPWMWLGGLMGLTVVFTITFAQPLIGATATIGILIAGQLVMGAVIDRFGLFGVDQIALSWPRLLGIVLLGAGAALSLVR